MKTTTHTTTKIIVSFVIFSFICILSFEANAGTRRASAVPAVTKDTSGTVSTGGMDTGLTVTGDTIFSDTGDLTVDTGVDTGSVDTTLDTPDTTVEVTECQDGQTMPCGVSEIGECSMGTIPCENGQWGSCEGAVNPTSEACDGKDNDCDGQVDEDFSQLGASCTVGSGSCEVTGEYVCNGSDVECNAVEDTTDSDGDGVPDCRDNCPDDVAKDEPGTCGCGTSDTDSDSDGTPDCDDACPSDPDKTSAGVCGCGVEDVDGDSDGTPDCNDNCPSDPHKTAAGICGCNVSDVDGDGDGEADCNDNCPSDPHKTEAGICGCGVSDDADADSDGTPDCTDQCDDDPEKTEPGQCGCGVSETLNECGECGEADDTDGDGTPDCNDTEECDGQDNDGDGSIDEDFANLGNSCTVGSGDCEVTGTYVCNATHSDVECNAILDTTDTDGDGTPDCQDTETCDDVDNDGDGEIDEGVKNVCGECGPATDTDGDGTPDCNDTEECDGVDNDGDGSIDEGYANLGNSCTVGSGGCEVTGTYVCNASHSAAECDAVLDTTDTDHDGTPDCNDTEECDGVDNDGDGEIDEGVKNICGQCGPALDDDGDGTPNCNDNCPDDADKTEPGQCGCGESDTLNVCGTCGEATDTDHDGTPDCNDLCPNDPHKTTDTGTCGCGVSEVDDDLDGTPNCNDSCPNDATKTAPEQCGCGVSDTLNECGTCGETTDTDGDGTPDCLETDDEQTRGGDLCENGNVDYRDGEECDGMSPVPNSTCVECKIVCDDGFSETTDAQGRKHCEETCGNGRIDTGESCDTTTSVANAECVECNVVCNDGFEEVRSPGTALIECKEINLCENDKWDSDQGEECDRTVDSSYDASTYECRDCQLYCKVGGQPPVAGVGCPQEDTKEEEPCGNGTLDKGETCEGDSTNVANASCVECQVVCDEGYTLNQTLAGAMECISADHCGNHEFEPDLGEECEDGITKTGPFQECHDCELTCARDTTYDPQEDMCKPNISCDDGSDPIYALCIKTEEEIICRDEEGTVYAEFTLADLPLDIKRIEGNRDRLVAITADNKLAKMVMTEADAPLRYVYYDENSITARSALVTKGAAVIAWKADGLVVIDHENTAAFNVSLPKPIQSIAKAPNTKQLFALAGQKVYKLVPDAANPKLMTGAELVDLSTHAQNPDSFGVDMATARLVMGPQNQFVIVADKAEFIVEAETFAITAQARDPKTRPATAAYNHEEQRYYGYNDEKQEIEIFKIRIDGNSADVDPTNDKWAGTPIDVQADNMAWVYICPQEEPYVCDNCDEVVTEYVCSSDGSKVEDLNDCPVEEEPEVTKHTCIDGTIVEDSSLCSAEINTDDGLDIVDNTKDPVPIGVSSTLAGGGGCACHLSTTGGSNATWYMWLLLLMLPVYLRLRIRSE